MSSSVDDGKDDEVIMTKKEQKLLQQELLEHNDFFDMVVDMIPSKLYIAGHSGDDFNPKIQRYYKNNNNEESKEARKHASKVAKRRKLDPASAESTRDMKNRIEQQTKEDENDDDDEVVDDDDDDEDEDEEERPRKLPQQKLVVPPGSSRIQALREKLHAKIAALGANRPAPETVSKRAARRADKQRRKQDATKKAEEKKKTAKAERFTTTTAPKPDDSLERLEFGRLTGFAESNVNNNYAATNKALRNLTSGKNLHKLLAEAEAKKQKLREATDDSSKKDIQWKDALKEAKGVRVKDDTVKIKKTLARKAASKAKSQVAWKARIAQQSSQQQKKQSIRNHNLDQRKKGGSTGANLSKKRIVSTEPKEGGKRRRAGFEGRKQEFLNKPKD